jgi:histidinol-phosphate/aromatic aminotransferase/cobyric acid decarboxylase-like protein
MRVKKKVFTLFWQPVVAGPALPPWSATKLLASYRKTQFLVDEAFIGIGGQSVAHLVPRHTNLMVTRTLSKAHSLAGFRVSYAILPEDNERFVTAIKELL